MHARGPFLLLLISLAAIAFAEDESGAPGDDALRERIEGTLDADLSIRLESQFSELLSSETTARLEAVQRSHTERLAMGGASSGGMRCHPSESGTLVCVIGAAPGPAAAAPAPTGFE